MGLFLHVLLTGGFLAACGPAGVKLKPGSVETGAVAQRNFECAAPDPQRKFLCLQDRTILGQEASLIGTIYKVSRAADRTCPTEINEVREEILPGLDKKSLGITSPATAQIDYSIVDHSVAASVKALSFLEASLSDDAVASIELLRTTRHIEEDQKFREAVASIAAAHPEACRLYVATGYSADSLTARVFKKQTAEGTGGVYGVNVSGKYFASDETIQRSFSWAVSIARIDIGTPPTGAKPALEFKEGKGELSNFSRLPSALMQ